MKSVSVSSIARFILLAVVFFLSFKLFPAWFPLLRREWLLLAFAVILLLIIPKPQIVVDKSILFTFCLFSFYLIIKSSIGTFLYPRVSFAVYDILMLFVAFYLPMIVLLKNDSVRLITKSLFESIKDVPTIVMIENKKNG